MKARKLAPLVLALSGCLGDASDLERDRAQLEAQAAVGTIVGSNGAHCLGTVIAANLVLTARGCGGDGKLDGEVTFELPLPDGTAWTATGEFAVADATANFASDVQAIVLSADAPVEPVGTNLAFGPEVIKAALEAGGAAISLDAVGALTRFDARIHKFAGDSMMVDLLDAEGFSVELTHGAPVLDVAGQMVGVISGNTLNLLKTQRRVVERALSSARGHEGRISSDLSIVNGKIEGTIEAQVDGDADRLVAALHGDWGQWWRKGKTDRFVEADGGATFYFAPISILGVQPIDIDVTVSSVTVLPTANELEVSQEFTVKLEDDFEGTIHVRVQNFAQGGARFLLTFEGVDENMFFWTTSGAVTALRAMFLGRQNDYGSGVMGRFSGLPGLIDHVEAAFSSAFEP